MFPARVRLRTEREEMYNALNHRLLNLCTKHKDLSGDNAKSRNFNFIWMV